MEWVEWQRKIGDIVEGKAPGYSRNIPERAFAGLLARVGATAGQPDTTQDRRPVGGISIWCATHKGGDDGSLSHHRPLCLIEVLRKVATPIATDRMRRNWTRLRLLDDANPGFQVGRTTANSILPLRLAAEHCVATKQHFAALLDDLKWCFELGLMRLGVPSYYYELY